MTLSNEERAALIANYKAKSRAMIRTVNVMIKDGELMAAVNRIYYGIFYMLSALALKDKFKTSRHEQLIGWFNKTYLKTNRLDRKYSQLIQKAFENRMESDYNVFAEFSAKEVEQAFAEMQEVIAAIEQLLESEEVKPNGQDQNL